MMKKCLIFIDDKEKCKTVKEELEEHGNKAGCPMILNMKIQLSVKSSQ